MLEAVPKNIFANGFFLQERDVSLGEIDASIWREKAQLEIEQGTYLLYREGYFSGAFVLERDGTVVARALKPSAIYNTFQVEAPNSRHLVLRRLALLNRRFGLFDGERQIGTIYPLHAFTRRTKIDLPADLPLPVRVFLFWLVFIIWKRDQAAS